MRTSWAAAAAAPGAAGSDRDELLKDQQATPGPAAAAGDKASEDISSSSSVQRKLLLGSGLPRIRTSPQRCRSTELQPAEALLGHKPAAAAATAGFTPHIEAGTRGLSKSASADGIAQQQPTSPSSARANSAGSAGSSPFSVGRSPRRNWRAAFVLPGIDVDDDDDENNGSGAANAVSAAQAAGVGGAGGGSRPVGFGLWGGLRLRHGPNHVDPLVAEYGMYAKVFATGGGCVGRPAAAAAAPVGEAGAAAAAGAGAFVGGEKHAQPAATGAASEGHGQAAEVLPGRTAAAAAAGAAAAGGVKAVSSGYVAGAMRELSLVALGGGGVVLRLEAYEMASMWDSE